MPAGTTARRWPEPASGCDITQEWQRRDHIQLFDIVSGVQFGPAWTGPTDVVTSLDFNPDGSRLLSAGADGTVRMWPFVKTCPDLPVAGEAE